jgi:glycosyltransferase involved in cell wall biosynthesis
MNKKPLVSIITVTFNAEADLEKCIKSVISQTYTNIEFIIIDGGSADGTLDIIEKYKKNISYSISEKDNGIYDAWNKGISHANGEWIAFLGSDDIFLENAIENYINHINKFDSKSIDIVSSRVTLVNNNGDKLRIIGKKWNWKIFRRYMCIAHVGSIHSKTYFNQYGTYNLNYKIVGDYEMLLRAKSNLRAEFINEITVEMKIGGASNNDNKAIKESFHAKIEHQTCKFHSAIYDFIKANVIFYIRKTLKRP